MNISLRLRLPSGKGLRNRIAKAAMSERLGTSDGAPSKELVRLYRRWASGGSGMLITGNVMIDRRALGETGNVSLEDARHLDSFAAWARAAKSGRRQGAHADQSSGTSGAALSQQRARGRRSVVPVKMGGIMGSAFAPPRALSDDEICALGHALRQRGGAGRTSRLRRGPGACWPTAI